MAPRADCPDTPAKAAQKDVDARWTVKFAKARTAVGGKPQIGIAIPSFGYKNHIAIDQRFGFIRKSVVTHGARHDRSQLREVVTTDNAASDVWADTGYRGLSSNGTVNLHKGGSRVVDAGGVGIAQRPQLTARDDIGQREGVAA